LIDLGAALQLKGVIILTLNDHC